MDGAISAVIERTFEELVRSEKQRVFAYLRRVVGDSSEAEALALEVFTRASRLQKAHSTASPELWLLRLATEVLRTRSRRPARFWPWRARRQPAAAPSCPAAAALPFRLECALRSLPLELRIAVVLHDVERLTCEQAAEAAGCSPAELRARVSAARGLLLPVLQADPAGGAPLRAS